MEDQKTKTMPAKPLAVDKNLPALGDLEQSLELGEQEELCYLPGHFHLTDRGNAQRMVALFGRNMHYCYVWKFWFIWDCIRWKRDDMGIVDSYAKATTKAMIYEAMKIEDLDQRKALISHAFKTEHDQRRKAMISTAQSERGIPVHPDDFDKDKWLLNVLNGTINLRTGKLLEHRREDLITKLAPVEFDPDADCPLWREFLARIFYGNQNLIDYLQRITGYALTGETKEQCWFFLYGFGANGKSTYLNVIKKLMGDYAKQAMAETFMVKRFEQIPADIADLKGVRFVASSEVEEGKQIAESLIKQLTGGDTITARRLYENFIQFVPECKIFLAVNHKPKVRETTYATWRRIKMITFNVQIPEAEQDKDLMEKLLEELPGILNWALEGCLEWQRKGDLGEPDEVRQATQDYRSEMDSFGDFLAACCVMDSQAQASATDLHRAYEIWAVKNQEAPLTVREIGLRMTNRGIRKKLIKNKTFYLGIGLTLRTRLKLGWDWSNFEEDGDSE